MSGYFLVNQSPPSFNWCSDGLSNSGLAGVQTLWNSVNTFPVYISKTGVSPSKLNNKKGTWNYTFVKTGKTTGTSTGTVSTLTSFTDSYNVSRGPGESNYTLTITDTNTGISFAFKNIVGWGIV
jgi:type II secretory pathway pseudopilin PulG